MSTKGKTWKRKTTPTPQEFYLARVIKDDSGCWDWSGVKDPNGYGIIHQNQKTPRKLAHRVSYELHHGPIPSGMLVCHHCDNPSCTRPDHLFLGTQTDNLQDASRKGRMSVPGKAWERRITHCPRGHAYGPPVPGTKRRCKQCHADLERRARAEGRR